MEELFQEHLPAILTTGGALLTALLSAVAGAVGWFARGRQRELEAEQTKASTAATEADSAVRALNETFEQLKQMRADYRAHTAEMNEMRAAHRKEVSDLEASTDKWREQYNDISFRFHTMRVQSKQLYADYQELRGKYQAVCEQFEMQRAELARFRSLVDEDPPTGLLEEPEPPASGRRSGDTPILGEMQGDISDDWQ